MERDIEEGTSDISSMEQVAFFLERATEADLDLARRILKREGGQPPAPEDEMPA